MSAPDFLAKGMAFVNDAVAADTAGDVQRAYTLYTNAVEYLMVAIKYQTVCYFFNMGLW